MARADLVSHSATPEPASRQPVVMAAVGASYAFDPGRDGIAGMYATRILERGGDPRAVWAEVRADRLGIPERGAVSRALLERNRPTRFGRGTASHLQATVAAPVPVKPKPASPTRSAHRRPTWSFRQPEVRLSRRLAAAGLAILLLLPLGVIAAGAQEAPRQVRYIVQPGDTLAGVAAEFGVDAAAILAASAILSPPSLTPEEVIVIPDPAESPDEAAWNAYQRQGTSPYVVGAHDVAEGETLADIAFAYTIDPWALASFNGISDIDDLHVGQRLLIPLTDTVVVPDAGEAASTLAADMTTVPSEIWEESTAPATVEGWDSSATPGSVETWESAPVEDWESAATESVGGADASREQPASGPVFAADVPGYMQMYSLSCEYAAAYIATAAFGPGVPESAFIEWIGTSANPHWGYRGNIHGVWGGTDDYGVYAEALVPTLNEYGFVADVFYGGDATSLTSRLDAGMPVITWLGYFGHNGWQQEDEGTYTLAPGMHAVTVYGYDAWGVYLVNPGNGAYDYYTWDDFLDKWSVLDGMALAVAPM